MKKETFQDDELEFDLEAFCLADIFEAHVYQWYKNQCLVGNATLLLAEKWGNRKHYVQKMLRDLNEISVMIRDGKKNEALSWIENVLSEEEASEMFLPQEQCKTVIRQLRSDLSIRKGRYGNYIYHKNSKMCTPSFHPLKNPNWKTMEDLELIAWIENTYHISI
jgi:hypothetical protein